jgi:hypothetical protein
MYPTPICEQCKEQHSMHGSTICARCSAERGWVEWNRRRELWNRAPEGEVLCDTPTIVPNEPEQVNRGVD